MSLTPRSVITVYAVIVIIEKVLEHMIFVIQHIC